MVHTCLDGEDHILDTVVDTIQCILQWVSLSTSGLLHLFLLPFLSEFFFPSTFSMAKFVSTTPGGAYATSYPSSYPSYGSNGYWNGGNSWTYSPSSWYGSYNAWRSDQRQGRQYSTKTNHNQQQQQQQPIQQQVENNNEYNIGTSRYSYGGKLNQITSKFTSTQPSRVSSTNSEIVQQQLMQY